jgi:hypothetical protein
VGGDAAGLGRFCGCEALDSAKQAGEIDIEWRSFYLQAIGLDPFPPGTHTTGARGRIDDSDGFDAHLEVVFGALLGVGVGVGISVVGERISMTSTGGSTITSGSGLE